MSILTIAYMLTENDRDDWLLEMLSDLSALPYPVVKFEGIVGDFSRARYNAYSSITSEYVLMVDPDDRIVPETVVKCLEFLTNNSEYVACSGQETSIDVNGHHRSTYPMGNFKYRNLIRTPLEFHGGVIFKVSAIKEFLKVIHDNDFYNFDWALRLCVANNYPVMKLKEIGSRFRRKPGTHSGGRWLRDAQVKPMDTVNRLVELGLVDKQWELT